MKSPSWTPAPEDEEEILVAVVEGFHIGRQSFVGIGIIRDDLLGIGPDHGVALGFGHRRDISCQDLVRDVFHAFQEADCQSFIRELLAAVHSPEAVFQVVVLHAAVALDIAVAAVVVRQQEAFVGDELSGAAAAEQDDGILQRGLIDAIDIFGGEAKSLRLHVADPLGDQGREPHAFIGISAHRAHQQETQKQECFFHEIGLSFSQK